MKVLVTGSTGFVGRALIRRLVADGYKVRAASRLPVDDPVAYETVTIGGIDGGTDWRPALEGVDGVVHLAARVHVMRDAPDGVQAFHRTNTEGTLNLANQAVASGARRFLFISSIKVNGEGTGASPYSLSSTPAPVDAYGASKLAAEVGLRAMTGLETVIIRPPLVYGPGVKGNLLRFCRLARAGVPVPFGSIANRRDLVGVENLVDVLERSLRHPAAAHRTFFVSDGRPMSTPELYTAIATAMDRPARMLRVPVPVLKALGALVGLGDEMNRLTGSLEVDIGETRAVLDWSPRQTVDAGIDAMVHAFLAQGR
jgi:nucleoside-diphosphate-sugar epimerase